MIKQYFDDNNLNYRQPFYAIFAIILTVALGFFAFSEAHNLPVFLIVGVAIGYVFTRSRFGFADGIKQLYFSGTSQLAIALLVLLGVTAFLTAGIQWSAASQGAVPAYLATAKQAIIPGSASVEYANIGTIIGGTLFGAGMMLAGGCASGTLTDFGEGEGHSIIALPFFILGSPLGLFLSARLDQSAIGKIGGNVYLPHYLGYIGSFLFLLLFLVILYGIVRSYQKHRLRTGRTNDSQPKYLDFEKPITEKTNSKLNWYHRVFIQRWTFVTTALLTSVIAAFIIITTGNSWGVTSAFTLQGAQFLHLLGLPLNDPAFAQIHQQIAQGGFLADGSSIRNFGIILGSLIAFLLAGRFKFNFNFHFRDSAAYAIGGLFMGVGARLAKGCNIGALYSGITNFSLHGYIFSIFLVLGSIATLTALEGKLVLFPKRNIYLKANDVDIKAV